MIVITPGHEETRRIFDDCVHSEATYNQYALYNRYGYYSTELYELSQAAPVFDIGDAESDGYASSTALTGRVNIRRYLNYVNFPNMMWYEKFNWDLYSCSNTKDRDFPVYSISFHYTLGHRDFFLPTHWFAYKYIFIMNDYWLSFRRELNESFFFTYAWLLLVLGAGLAVARYVIGAVSYLTVLLYPYVGKKLVATGMATGVVKMIVAALIGVFWDISVEIVPYQLFPSQGYLFFFLFYSYFLSVLLLGFNKATSVLMGSKMGCKSSLLLLLGTHGAIACLCRALFTHA